MFEQVLEVLGAALGSSSHLEMESGECRWPFVAWLGALEGASICKILELVA